MGIFVRPQATQWSLPVAGLTGIVLLVLVTSGLPGPTPVFLTLGLTGMGVLVVAWLGLRRSAPEMPVTGLYRIAVVWYLPLLCARPLFSGDIRIYLAQGVTAAEGIDPYRFGPLSALGPDSPVVQQVSHYWQDTPAPYGPVWLAISRAIAQVAGENLVATLLLNRLVELAGLALVAWALPRLARRTGGSPGFALWLGLLNPLVLWHIIGGAHNDGLMVGLVLAGTEITLGSAQSARTTLAQLTRLISGLALLTIAAQIKIVAAAAVCCVGAALARRYGRTMTRGVVVMAGVLTGFALLSLAISMLTGFGLGWLGTVSSPADVHSWMAPTNQLGFLAAGGGALFGADITSAAITLACGIGAVAGAIAGAWLVWSIFRGRRDPVRSLGLVFAAMLVTGPVVQPWYLLWAIPLLAAGVRTDPARRPLVLVSALFAMLLPPDGKGALLAVGYAGAAGLLALLWWCFAKKMGPLRELIWPALPEQASTENAAREAATAPPSP